MSTSPGYWTRRPHLVPRLLAYAVVVPGAVVMAAPFLWMITTSLSDEPKLFQYPPQFFPDPIRWQNYAELFGGFETNPFKDANTFSRGEAMPLAYYMWNSVVVAVFSTLGTVLSCAMGAFALARLRFPGRNFWFALTLATLLIPGQILLIPRYFIFRNFGWLDTLLPLIVPHFFAGAFGIFLLHQFFRGIPEELVDAARIDGANPLDIFARLMLPLSGAALATLAIFQFLYSWNDLLGPLIFLNTDRSYTFPIALTRFKHHVSGQYMWTIVCAGAFLGTIPPIIVYVLGQRHFVQGIALSGIKR
jgi:multiple sugar transport system permease protein